MIKVVFENMSEIFSFLGSEKYVLEYRLKGTLGDGIEISPFSVHKYHL